jgi:hypothetical protein
MRRDSLLAKILHLLDFRISILLLFLSAALGTSTCCVAHSENLPETDEVLRHQVERLAAVIKKAKTLEIRGSNNFPPSSDQARQCQLFLDQFSANSLPEIPTPVLAVSPDRKDEVSAMALHIALKNKENVKSGVGEKTWQYENFKKNRVKNYELLFHDSYDYFLSDFDEATFREKIFSPLTDSLINFYKDRGRDKNYVLGINIYENNIRFQPYRELVIATIFIVSRDQILIGVTSVNANGLNSQFTSTRPDRFTNAMGYFDKSTFVLLSEYMTPSFIDPPYASLLNGLVRQGGMVMRWDLHKPQIVEEGMSVDADSVADINGSSGSIIALEDIVGANSCLILVK